MFAFRASKGPTSFQRGRQDASKTPQEGPKNVQEAPRRLREAEKKPPGSLPVLVLLVDKSSLMPNTLRHASTWIKTSTKRIPKRLPRSPRKPQIGIMLYQSLCLFMIPVPDATGMSPVRPRVTQEHPVERLRSRLRAPSSRPPRTLMSPRFRLRANQLPRMGALISTFTKSSPARINILVKLSQGG